MIRQISEKEWAICYDADGSVFEDGFGTQEAAQTRFNRLRLVDQMIVACRPPKSNTDVEFLSGCENGRQFQNRPEHGDALAAEAAKSGVNVKGKKYLGQLNSKEFLPGGDPRAWVSGRGDVQKVLEERGWGSEGLVNVKARLRVEPPKPVDVAEDIIQRETSKEAMPGMKKRELLDLREKVRTRLKGNLKK